MREQGTACGVSPQGWAVLAFAFVLALTQTLLFASLAQPPGPLYGGDVYFHLGVIHHVYNTLAPWRDPIFRGEFVYYPPGMHLLVALAAGAASLSVSLAARYFPVLISLSALWIMYGTGRRMHNRTYAAVLAVLFASAVPLTHPSVFAKMTVLPLLITLYYFARRRRDFFLAGAAYSLGSVESIVIALGLFVFFFVVAADRALTAATGGKPLGGTLRALLRDHAFFLAGFAAMLPLFLALYWWPVLFHYRLNTANPWQEYTGLGVSSVGFQTLRSLFEAQFLARAAPLEALFSALAGGGALYAARLRSRLPFLVLLTGVAATMHPVVTRPLLGMSFGWYRFPVILEVSRAMFAAYGTLFLLEAVPGGKRPLLRGLLVLAVAALLSAGYLGSLGEFRSGRWTSMGFENNALTGAVTRAGDWMMSRDPDGVVLSLHPESSMALFGVSGSKQVFCRRTHANLFVDVDRRNADAAVMLFGKDREAASRLLREYGVSRLFVDPFGVQAARRCSSAKTSALSCILTAPRYGAYLAENGVPFREVRTRLDPGDAGAPVFDMLAVVPPPEGPELRYWSGDADFAESGVALFPLRR